MSAAPSGPLSVREYFSAQRELYSADDAARIGPELERLADAGVTKAGEIVDAARPTDAPLHPYFEWDDRRAAEGFRCMQASRMARTIVVKTVRGGKPVEELAFRPTAIRVVRSEATTVTPAPARAFTTEPGHKVFGAPQRPAVAHETDPAETPARVRPTAFRERVLDPGDRRAPLGGTSGGQSVINHPVGGSPLDGVAASVKELQVDAAVSKLSDDDLIGRAMARLLGFEATYASERKREAFEAVFAPVFMAIEMAQKRAGLEGTTTS